MKNVLIAALLCMASLSAFAQNKITFSVNDFVLNETLIGVNIYIPSLAIGGTTDIEGKCTITNIPDGSYSVRISYIGYESQTLEITFPNRQSIIAISLESNAEELAEAIVMSNRSNRSVLNMPSRVEVITDEIEEAATMDPSKIAHLLMHTTGVQVQQTSATSGAASVRIQGQYGRYTQILKDGFPIYGGFAGGLGVLQIPPLDLRQVEFVKGSSSTLYGGGAIAGLINLISKEPTDKEEFSMHLNLSHIGNTDLNSFYSNRNGKWGVTVFASNNTNPVYDVDNDGFTDVPEVRKFNFNPRLFYYINEKTTASFGGTFTNENRIGGDVQVVEGAIPDSLNNYFERNESQQVTTQFSIKHNLTSRSSVQLKNSTNTFDRRIYLHKYAFSGTQFSTFSEFNYALNAPNYQLVLGANVYTDEFKEKQIATPQLRNQNLVTYGVFGQHIWDIHKKLAMESGFRLDYNADYGLFPLPKIALVYKPNVRFTARLGGGLGYKLPSIFTEDNERLAFEGVLPIDDAVNKAERSYGVNGELTFRILSKDKFSLTLTEYLFYNYLDQPLVLVPNTNFTFSLINSNGYFETRGIESLVKASAGDFHLYLGYTFVGALQHDNGQDLDLPLTPRHSIHSDLMYVVEGKWRVGIDAEYESEQTLATGRKVQALFKAGFLAERTMNKLSVYINLENWTDTRQTRYESLVQPTFDNPRFTEVWAPLDGFIFNAGLKLKM